jgi:hypothetical protein
VHAHPQAPAVAGTLHLGAGSKAPFPLPLLRSLTGVKPVPSSQGGGEGEEERGPGGG